MNDLFSPIGVLHTVFKEKFGVPRQSGMMSEGTGILKLNADSRYHAALSRLEEFSHIWVIFIFDKNKQGDWHPIVDPPGEEPISGVGVFASRSPYRPNPIGLSAVKLERIDYDAYKGIELHLSGVDILDGTAVLDIKPYLPYADKVEGANSGWVLRENPKYEVTFSEAIESELRSPKVAPVKALITQMLAHDPRPTSQIQTFPMKASHSQGKRFAFRVQGLDVKWEVAASGPHVVEIVELA